MPISEKRKQYLTEYRKKKIKRVPFDIPVELYEQIKNAAEENGETVNGFIKRVVQESIK